MPRQIFINGTCWKHPSIYHYFRTTRCHSVRSTQKKKEDKNEKEKKKNKKLNYHSSIPVTHIFQRPLIYTPKNDTHAQQQKNNEWEKQMQSFIFFSLYIMAFPFKRSESWVSQGQSGEDLIRAVQRWRDSNTELSHTNKSKMPILYILLLCTLQKSSVRFFFSVNLPSLSYTNWYIRTSTASMSDKKRISTCSPFFNSCIYWSTHTGRR